MFLKCVFTPSLMLTTAFAGFDDDTLFRRFATGSIKKSLLFALVANLHQLQGVFFYTGPPPKSSKYKKVNQG